MKFSNKDFENLKEAIKNAKIDLELSRQRYLSKKIGNDPERRFIWDVFWASGWSKNNRGNEYKDTHIETATKKAIKQLISK